MGMVKMVIPITSRDAKVWAFKMRNIKNSERAIHKWHGKLEARIVLYGPGLKLLPDPSLDTQVTIDPLRADGVRFDICNNTLKAMNLEKRYPTAADIVRKRLKLVPFGSESLILAFPKRC